MTEMTMRGRLVADPDVAFTASGTCRARLRLADTPRRYDAGRGEWVDGEPVFMTCTGWRGVAEDIAEAGLTRGERVIVTGRLRYREWETDAGEKRSAYELVVDELARSVRGVAAAKRRAAGVPAASTAPASPGDGAYGGDEPPF